MDTTQQQRSVRCPDCGDEQLSLLETISLWQWERPVYGCDECHSSFVGPWRNTHGDVVPGATNRRPALAIAD